MERRFKIFAEVGVRNLKIYQHYVKSIKTGKNLPYIVIIDELADLMLSAPVGRRGIMQVSPDD